MNPLSYEPCFFDNFPSDPKVTVTNSYFVDSYDNPEPTFLPNGQTFYDTFDYESLQVTREDTEMTEVSDVVVMRTGSFTTTMYQTIPEPNPYLSTFSPEKAQSNSEIQYSQSPGSNLSASSPFERKLSLEEPQGSMTGEEENDETELDQIRAPYALKVWSEEKDKMLLKFGTQFKGEWKKIAKKFGHKFITPCFVKNRYKELTFAPIQKRFKFHPAEDLMIAKYFEVYGSNWSQMSTHFKNRTPVMLKNRYYSFIKKKGLMDFLIQKVKQLEKNDRRVDDIVDKESQKTFGLVSEALIESTCAHTSSSLEHLYCTEEKHRMFGCEKDYNHGVASIDLAESPSPVYSEQEQITAQPETENKEMLALREQVQLFQSLYYKTKAELDDLKSRINAQ